MLKRHTFDNVFRIAVACVVGRLEIDGLSIKVVHCNVDSYTPRTLFSDVVCCFPQNEAAFLRESLATFQAVKRLFQHINRQEPDKLVSEQQSLISGTFQRDFFILSRIEGSSKIMGSGGIALQTFTMLLRYG